MRVLFLSLQAHGRSPSQRYRVEAFEPLLRAAGIEVVERPVLTADDLRIFYGHAAPPAKARVALTALLRRAASVRPRLRSRPDVVLVQREAFFLLGAWSEWLASLQAPIVYDFDDAIWIHAVSEANRRFAFLKNVEKVARLVGLAHTVIAGNDFLGAWARQHSRNVHVVPTCVDTAVFRPAPRPPEGPVIIGWSGSPTTLEHYKTILPALRRVKARYGERVRFRLMGAPSFRDDALRLAGEAWSEAAEVPFLQQMHVGLMPLPDDEWSRGKCGLKGLTSMASGAATVMSKVGVNTTIVTHGVDGLHASTEDEWVGQLSALVDDAALRDRLGAAGRERVVNHYSVQRWAPTLIALLQTAASSRGTARHGLGVHD
ncbi:MAG: glycosyltransferase family 4 protein [Myxococcaceae bacterium]|nr:glycosyltransferase family 4 protein [Myxococcaceae bacterium]MCA3014151.1 glycosyltransferase family 4 protein [Myxococcaceae bacterium]